MPNVNNVADFYPDKINLYVPEMHFHSDVDTHSGIYRADLGTPIVADPDGILDGQSIASAGSTTTFDSAYSDSVMGVYGRNVTVVASGAATSTVTVKGRDYLGQPMLETLTLDGTNAVAGKKAFKKVEEVSWAATAGRTIDLGWGDALGLPFAAQAVIEWIEDGVAATAGTFVAEVTTDPATATTGDPRGTADFNGTLDGSMHVELVYMVNKNNLHGVAHYYA